jgi:hypothetical protein
VIRLVLIGIWASLITIASNYGAAYFRQAHASKEAAAPAPELETRKTKEINVPKIRDGVVKGYVVMQFSYVLDASVLKKSSFSPDAFVVDEAFRHIYDDESIDFSHLEKVNLRALAEDIVKKANARFKAQVVTDIAFQEFTFVASPEVKSQL